MYVHKVHMYVASAFSVNGTFQIMGPSKGGTQGVPISVAQLYRKKKIQSSGQLFFSAGSNYNQKILRPEKKVQSSGRRLK